MNTIESAVASVSTALPQTVPPVIVTNADVIAFCAHIRAGAPSSGILPMSVGELKKLGILTVPQQDAIKQARKDHERIAGENSVEMYRLMRSRQLKAVRFNKDAQIIGARFGAKKVVKEAVSLSAFALYGK